MLSVSIYNISYSKNKFKLFFNYFWYTLSPLLLGLPLDCYDSHWVPYQLLFSFKTQLRRHFLNWVSMSRILQELIHPFALRFFTLCVSNIATYHSVLCLGTSQFPLPNHNALIYLWLCILYHQHSPWYLVIYSTDIYWKNWYTNEMDRWLKWMDV